MKESSEIASQQLPGFASASKLPPLPSATLGKRRRSRSLSPSSSPSEPDYSKWFEPLPEVQSVPKFVSFGRPTKDGGSKSIVVSEEKLKFASQRMRDWEADESYEPNLKVVVASQAQSEPAPTPAPAPAQVSAPPPRPIPPPFKPPLLPKTPRHSVPQVSANPLARARASLALERPSTPQPSTSTSAPSPMPPPATEPAKPKVYTYHHSHPSAPITPAATSKTPVASITTPAPLTPGAFSTPITTGKKVYGMNTRSVGRHQPKFKTPFKAGLAPGEPRRLELERKATERMKTALANASKPTPAKAQAAKVEAKRSGHVAFDLSASCVPLRGS